MEEFAGNDVGNEVVESAPVMDEGAATPDPWESVRGLGVEPEKLVDTWQNYTQKTQQLSEKEKQLQPFAELADEIRGNPELQAYIQAFYQQGANPQIQLEAVRNQMTEMQFEMKMEKAFQGLERFVKENDLPEYDEEKVMKFMVDKDIVDPMVAYQAMAFDEIRNKERDKTINEIKQSRGAVPVRGTGRGEDNAATGAPTMNDIASMSSEDFKKNYGQILDKLAR